MQTQIQLLLAAAVALCLVLAASSPVAAKDESFGTAGEYDTYVLARSWSAEFCASSSDPECEQITPTSFAASNLALHGLWPQYTESQSGHDWPQFCQEDNETYWNKAGHVIPEVQQQMNDAWTKYAPGYLTGLDEHEWERHGSCYSSALIGMSTNAQITANQLRYFKNQIALLENNPTPAIITKAAASGDAVDLADLQAAFGGANMVGLSCDVRDGAAYLSQVAICLDHDNNGNPTSQVQCPTSVISSSYDNSCAYPNPHSQVTIKKWGHADKTPAAAVASSLL